MNTFTRSFIWIAVIFTLLAIELQTRAVAQVGDVNSAPQIVTLSVKAYFDQGDKKLRYFSYWSGKLPCQCVRSKNGNESLQVCFPLGLGVSPSSLSVHWAAMSKEKKMKNTGPVFISLVKPKAKPSEILAWTKMKELNDPSFTITLVASTGKEKQYTNEEEVEAKIVAWLTDKKETICPPLAQLRIPERSILLKYSSDKYGKPLVELTIQSMRIIDTEDDTWTSIIRNGNRHLELPSNPKDAECRSFTARDDTEDVQGSKGINELEYTFLQAYRAGDRVIF